MRAPSPLVTTVILAALLATSGRLAAEQTPCMAACSTNNKACTAPVLPAWRVCMDQAKPACDALPGPDKKRCTQNASSDCSLKGRPVVEACSDKQTTCVEACMAAEKKANPAAAAAPPAPAGQEALGAFCDHNEGRAAFLGKVEASRGKNERETTEFEIDEVCAVKAMPRQPRFETTGAPAQATHAGNANVARYSDDQKTIVTGGDDGTVRIFDAESGQQLQKFDVAPPPPENASFARTAVRDLRLIGKSGKIAVATDNMPVGVLDTASGKIVTELPPGPETDQRWRVGPRLDITAGGLLLMAFTPTRAPEAWAFDLAANRLRYKLGGHVRGVTAVAVSDVANLMATGMRDEVRLWRTDTGQQTGTISRAGSGTADSIAFSRDGRLIAIAFGGTVDVYDVASTALLQSVKVHPLFLASDVAFTADGKGLLTCRGYPILWDIATGKITRRFGPFVDTCQKFSVSPDGRFLVSTARASDVRIWEIATGTFHRRLGRPQVPWR